MSVIKTTAPISIDSLKKYFADKSVNYIIDYDNSSLKGQKLLTYLGNLDLPCDIELDFTKEDHFDLLKEYLETNFLVKISNLEKAAMECLFEKKGLINSSFFSKFIEDNKDTLDQWESRLESLTLFNLWILNSEELKTWVQTHTEDNADVSKYVNFVNLLKHEDFYQYYLKIDQTNLKNYKNLFNDYCFKGKNLYEYWANDFNPMFLLTWSIASGHMNVEEYLNAKKKDIEVLQA
jgi:hypothetical protein